MGIWTALTLGGLILVGGGPSALGGPRSSALPCDDPAADPWVSGLRDRVLSRDALAHSALALYGEPVACEGSVTAEFEGAPFGRLALSFVAGVTLTVETAPPETSVTTLSAPSGFADNEPVLAALREYAASRGLEIDWTTPEVTGAGDEVVQTFWDPDEGLNGSASLIFSTGTLVAVRVAMAL